MRETERNAVTWGVFPGQEIVQSTIIEQESFLTWKVRSTRTFSTQVLEWRSAGRGLFHLDRLGETVLSRVAGTTTIGKNQKYPLVG